jgi:hypothetical protein
MLKLNGTEMVLKRPIVYQGAGAGRQIIESQYIVAGNKIRFRLGNYDHHRELVIDPSFVFLTTSAVPTRTESEPHRTLARRLTPIRLWLSTLPIMFMSPDTLSRAISPRQTRFKPP